MHSIAAFSSATAQRQRPGLQGRLAKEREEDVGPDLADAPPAQREAQRVGHFRLVGAPHQTKGILLNHRSQQATVQSSRRKTSCLLAKV